MDDNALDFNLAKSVREYFRLNEEEMNVILSEVLTADRCWKDVAKTIGIKNREMQLMEGAFRWE